jgi:MFS family permease
VSAPRGSEHTGFGALVTASLVVTAAANLSPTLVSALAVQIQDDLGIGEAQIGMTVSAFFFVGALTSALSGRMVERIGPTAGLRLSAAAAGAVLVVTGALGRSWMALMILVGLAGLANSLGQPAANLYVARGVSSRRQGLALGIQKSGIPAASLLAGLAIPTVGLTIGWSWAFVLGGLLAFGVTLGVPAVGGTALAAVRNRAAAYGTTVRPRPDVAMRLLVAVTCSTCLAAMGSMALSSFFVLSSVEIGIDEAAAGILLMAGSVVGMASRLAMGASADRASLSPFHMLTAMFAVAALAFVGLSTGSKAMLYTAMPFAFATSFAWPGLFHLATVRYNPSAPGAATGITMTGNFTGAVCGPLLFGLLVEATSYGWAWGFAAITSGAAAAVMAVAGRLISQRVHHERP